MSQKSSAIWIFALPVSLVILVGAYYIKVPGARRFIDAHTPLGQQLFGRFVPEAEVVELPGKKASGAADSAAGDSGKSTSAGSSVDLGPIAAPAPPEPFSLQKLEQNPARWPKKVTIKKAANFPAVVNHQVVGSLVAPAGSEVNLNKIQNGKLGLEYKGGGAWFSLDDTDLEARVMAQ